MFRKLFAHRWMLGLVVILASACGGYNKAIRSTPPPSSVSASRGILSVEEAQRALKEGRYEEAWHAFNALTQGAQQAPAVRFWAGESAIHLGRCEDALMHLTGLETELVAVADEIWARKARCYELLGAIDDALTAWHEALMHTPSVPIATDARYSMGALWEKKGNPVAAVVAFNSALALSPKDARADGARLQVAGLESAQGNWRGAKALLTHLVAVGKDPIAQKAADALGRLSQDHPEAAVEAQQEAARADREDGDTGPSWQAVSSVREAQRLLAQKRPDDAVLALRQLWRRAARRDRVAVATALGNMLAQLGRTDDAVRVFDTLAQSLGAGPKKQDAQFRAAYLVYDGKQYSQAKRRFQEFLGNNPRHPSRDEALWFSGWCGFHLGEIDAALTDLAQLRRQYPQSSLIPRAQWWQARLLALRYRDDEATGLLRDLVRDRGYYGMLARRSLQLAPKEPLVAVDGEPDEEQLAFLLAQGTQSLNWAGPQGARVSTLIALELMPQAASWVRSVPGLPGVPARKQALGRGQILTALKDYTLAMREVTPFVGMQWADSPDVFEQAALKIAYPRAYAREVLSAAAQHDVSWALLLSLMRQESAFNSRAASPVSAQGLMQIMPVTGRRIASCLNMAQYTDDLLLTPEINVQFAAWYIKALLKRFDNNLPIAIGSYNAGPKVMQQWLLPLHRIETDVFIEDIPYRETRDYIKKVMANLEMYGRIYGVALPTWPREVTAAASGINF